MKNLHIVIKSSFLAIALFSLETFSADVVAITKVKGPSFGVIGGVAKMLTPNFQLAEKAEIMTDESGQVSFRDFFDHTYHLSSGSQVVLLKNGVELRAGMVWVQAHKRSNVFQVKTINGVVEFQGGEFIVSFNEETGKTQLMSISGQADFYNALETQLRLTVESGQFSLIDQKYQKGMPRVPTPIGFDSFKKATAYFEGVTPMSKEEFQTISSKGTAPKVAKDLDLLKREIASVDTARGEANSSAPAVVEEIPSAAAYLEQIQKPRAPAQVVEALAKPVVKIYRYSSGEIKATIPPVAPVVKPVPAPATVSRQELPMPAAAASVATAPMPATTPKLTTPFMDRNPSSVSKDQDAFDKSLQKAYETEPKHEGEVQDLIKELKSYQKDFQSTY